MADVAPPEAPFAASGVEVAGKETKEASTVDAGLLPLDHYKYRLPRWRYVQRQKLLPLVRWETPYLAYLQEHVRTPLLDSYFALSANLGTHTFFMIMLPIMFWFGYTNLGRGMVHVLASGVFFSGFLKDLLCLPRPLSPPLHRITMSGSVALEYGFPSTHSTNAVSVAVYALLSLGATPDVDFGLRVFLQVLAAVYTVSIIFGRLYCGMHGFLDVFIGAIIGAAISIGHWLLKDSIDVFLLQGSIWAPLTVLAIILILVRLHPEPADPCPCFDDGVAFAAVVAGVEVGYWHYSKLPWSWNEPVPATVPFLYNDLGLPKTLLRVLLGVFVIFAWREIAKPAFHQFLPPIFRLIERAGLILPRKDFTPASEYKKVPNRLPDDTLPSLNEIPAMIHNTIRTRSRSDSVGPQSAADAYETLAYREKRRRESGSAPVLSRKTTDIEKYESEMGNGSPNGGQYSEEAVAEMLRRIEKPRVRYDVEVVTKLVVYAGIAWWAVEGCPLLFEAVGLGMGSLRAVAR